MASGESGSASSSASLSSSVTGSGLLRTRTCGMPCSALALTLISGPTGASRAVQPCRSSCCAFPVLTGVGVRVTFSIAPLLVRRWWPSVGAGH
eukprot:scaffold69750_cov71-Phaeocystis_antarctica.AAC.1